MKDNGQMVLSIHGAVKILSSLLPNQPSSNMAVEVDGHKLRLWFPTLRSGRPSLLR